MSAAKLSHLSPTSPIESTLNRWRYRRILVFFAGVFAHIIVLDILLGRVPLIRGRVRTSRTERFRRFARRFRALAVDMGGVLIKLGQFLSARVDVLPPEITEELAGLQDEVPPVAYPDIERVLQIELGEFATHYLAIEQTPLAAASLGQVHRAQLHLDESSQDDIDQNSFSKSNLRHHQQIAGQKCSYANVVVKVQRPGIADVVQTDLTALRMVAQWAMRYKPIRQRADVPALMEEFAKTLWEELDYHAEAANAARFTQIFFDENDVRVPNIYTQHSTGRVLIMENVEGIKIDDKEGMIAVGISPTAVAERLLDTYFKQVFQEGFFHADPHPGNIFIHPLPHQEERTHDKDVHQISPEEDLPTPFQIIYIDFGMMGRIKELMGNNLRRVLLSVASQDARELTRIYSDMGFFLPSADLERIADAQEEMLGRVWGRSLKEMARPDMAEVQELTTKFKDILNEFPFQVPQDFVYLGRAVGMISGLTSQLHPNINLWTRMEAYALTIVGDQKLNPFSFDRIVEELRQLIPLPAQVRRVIRMAEKGELRVRTTESASLARRLERLEKQSNQLNGSIIACSGLISGTLFYINGYGAAGLTLWGVSGFVIFLSALRK